MAKYLNVMGHRVGSTNISRLVWYSAGGCGYWTDDWEKLNCVGIPTCPNCGAVGFQVTAEEWERGAIQFEESGNLGYLDFCNKNKETCLPGESWMDRFKKEVKE